MHYWFSCSALNKVLPAAAWTQVRMAGGAAAQADASGGPEGAAAAAAVAFEEEDRRREEEEADMPLLAEELERCARA